MRLTLAMLAAFAFLPSVSQAVPVGVPTVPYINVALGSGNIRLLLPAVDADGTFRDSRNVVLCDGSVREATACASDELLDGAVSLSVRGSIFPEVSGVVAFTDFGAPTSLAVTFGTPIPVIPGLAETELSGSFTVPQVRTSPPPAVTGLFGLPFVGGGVIGSVLQTVAFVPDDSITPSNSAPVTTTWDPIAGTFDCALVGGCESIYLTMGFNGLGDGTFYQIGGRFDVDAAVTTPVPLPAPLALLAVGLGLMGLAGRRRA